MARYEIVIDESAIQKQIEGILGNILTRELKNRYSNSGLAMSEAIKDLIYSRKDEIIEMVVDRASKEIVKKGMPKFLDAMMEGK